MLNVTLKNFPAVGISDDTFFAGKTSLQYINPYDKRFGPASTKMSKDASVLTHGCVQRPVTETGGLEGQGNSLFSGDFTNRRGLHIYLRRACSASSGKGYSDWHHSQSIIRDDENLPLNVNEITISADGSSIIVLSRGQIDVANNIRSNYKIHVFERELSLNQQKEVKWTLQQTFSQPTIIGSSQWNLINANDDHTMLVVQSTIDNHFEVYGRQRSTKIAFNKAADGYIFKKLQTILPSEFSVISFQKLSALSHDAKKLMITTDDVQITEMHFDFLLKKYIFVRIIPFSGVLYDLKFGGTCSKRLFLLKKETSLTVSVYSNLWNEKNKNNACCNSFNEPFALFSIVNVDFTDLPSIESLYNFNILTEAVDGDFFIVLASLKGSDTFMVSDFNNKFTISALAFRQKLKTPNWCATLIDEIVNFPQSVYYAQNAYDMLSYQSDCERFVYPFRQQMMPITFPSLDDDENGLYRNSSMVYVSNPNGCLALTYFDWDVSNAGNPNFYWYYYRVADSREPFVLGTVDLAYGEMANGLGFVGSFININKKTCASKYLDVKVVDARAHVVPPTPTDLLTNPSLVYYSLTIPMRLCFSIVDLKKI